MSLNMNCLNRKSVEDEIEALKGRMVTREISDNFYHTNGTYKRDNRWLTHWKCQLHKIENLTKEGLEHG